MSCDDALLPQNLPDFQSTHHDIHHCVFPFRSKTRWSAPWTHRSSWSCPTHLLKATISDHHSALLRSPHSDLPLWPLFWILSRNDGWPPDCVLSPLPRPVSSRLHYMEEIPIFFRYPAHSSTIPVNPHNSASEVSRSPTSPHNFRYPAMLPDSGMQKSHDTDFPRWRKLPVRIRPAARIISHGLTICGRNRSD